MILQKLPTIQTIPTILTVQTPWEISKLYPQKKLVMLSLVFCWPVWLQFPGLINFGISSILDIKSAALTLTKFISHKKHNYTKWFCCRNVPTREEFSEDARNKGICWPYNPNFPNSLRKIKTISSKKEFFFLCLWTFVARFDCNIQVW